MPATTSIGVIEKRYQIEQKLGQGASGIVYRVYDTKTRRRVALKLLRADFGQTDGTQRFFREFTAIQALRHPNILAVHDLGKTYFTMEYVEGTSLNPQEKRDTHSVLHLAIEVCRALQYIHSQGIVHGDLKPQHIMIAPSGALKLIDFGLSEEVNASVPMEDGGFIASGTLDYMAPEQAKGSRRDPRSDLYALGVVLYELCTGRLPFTDESPMGLIMKHIEAPPRPPREYNPQIPEALEAVTLKLLAKDPADRHQSADELLSVLTQLVGRREIQEARVERGSRFLFDPKFSGRDRELATLETLFDLAASGRTQWVLVHGERGMGASRLVHDFGSKHFFAGATVLTGRCERNPEREYASFASWVMQGFSILEKQGTQAQRQSVLKRPAAGLKKIAPLLSEREELAAIRPPIFSDPRRIASNLGEFLKVLSEIRPVLLILEDAHLMDPLSCILLEHLRRQAASLPALVCLTAKDPLSPATSEFGASVSRLSAMPDWHDLFLKPLSGADVAAIGASMIGRDALDPALAQKLISAARGSPLVAQETMKAFAEQGVLYKKGGVWHVDTASIAKIKPSADLENWLLEKAEHLSPEHGQVLAAASLIRRRITFDLLEHLTGLDVPELHRALADLVRERLLSEERLHGRRVYAPESERVADRIYQKIPEAQRRKWHTAAAEFLEGLPPGDQEAVLEEIARHAGKGKSPAKALPYLVRSAERAAKLMAYRSAIELFREALKIGAEARNLEESSEIHLRIAELTLESGDPASAQAPLEDSLQAARKEGRPALEARAHLRLAQLFLRLRKLDAAADHLVRCRALYQKLDDPVGLVQHLLTLSRVQAAKYDRENALELTRQALETAQKVGDDLLLAEVYEVHGAAQLALKRFAEAIEPLRTARYLAEKLESQGGLFQASLSLAEAYLGLNQPEDARPLIEYLRFELVNAAPRQQGSASILLAMWEMRQLQFGGAQALFDRAVRLLEEADDPWLLANAHARYGEAMLAQAREASGSRRKEAIRHLREARELYGRASAFTSQDRMEAMLRDAQQEFVEGDIGALRKERDDLRVLQKVIATVNSELDLERLLNMIMDMVIEVVKAERGFLLLMKDAPNPSPSVSAPPRIEIAVARNIDKETVEKPEFKISHTIAQMVLDHRQPILARDAQTDERFKGKISVLNLKLRSILCVPLLSKQKMIGAVYVDNRFVSERFNEENLRLLVAFADQAAVAIENARLYQENLRRQRELEEANRSIRALNEQLQQKVLAQGQELAEVKQVLEERYSYHNLIARSEPMQSLFRQLEKIRETDAPILIQGESGTGKELIARAVHYSSPRKERKFVSENCAAISPTLLESELFGYMRGAFTGAVKDRKGLFEQAHEGTLFLDEIGEMSLEMQSSLLRALEQGEIRPVGGNEIRKVNVRIVAATNKDLKSLVGQGKFREDLYYRLNVVRLDLPPLRDRREDIPILAEHFLREGALKNRAARKRLSAGAVKALVGYPWPGNVRELKNVLERLALLSAGEVIQEEEVRGQLPAASETRLPDWSASNSYKQARRQVLDAFDQRYLKQALQRNANNISAAAREIGIERQYFHKILKRLEALERGEPAPDEDEP